MSEYRHKIRRPDMRMALVLCANFDGLSSSMTILEVVEWLLQEPLSSLMSDHRACPRRLVMRSAAMELNQL